MTVWYPACALVTVPAPAGYPALFVSVRAAGPGDDAAVARLRWAWRTEEAGEAGLALAEFTPAFAAWWHEHASSHLGWLAEVDGHPAGMAWLAVLDRIPGPERWERRSGSLQSVYVPPRYRGNGIGTALVAAVVDEAVRLGLDYVVVHPTERSFPLYRRAGFAEYPGALELRLRARAAQEPGGR